MNDNHKNSRRDFLKKATVAGVVAFAVPELFAAPAGDEKKYIPGNGLVFLFQGDSITDGNRGRNKDPNHIMGHGYAFSIASRVGADFPEKHLTFYNRGISGNKVTDLDARWQQDTLDLKPNVLSILVGVNDASSAVFGWENSVTPEKYRDVYSSLLDRTRIQFPEILFVLCEPFILPVGKVKDYWEKYSADVKQRQEIVREMAQKQNAVFVPLQDVFNNACKRAPADYWIWDGVHPTVAGHELIAREWLKQVSKRINFLKKEV